MCTNLQNWPILTFLEPEFVASVRLAYVFGNLGNEALLVTTDDTVYALGANDSGCLGLGHLNSTFYQEKINGLTNISIKSFASGADKTVLALTSCGKVYLWGKGCSRGQGRTVPILSPVAVKIDEHVVHIACGNQQYYAVTNNHKIYTWQFATYLHPNLLVGEPRLKQNEKIVSIACSSTGFVAAVNTGFLLVANNPAVNTMQSNSEFGSQYNTTQHNNTVPSYKKKNLPLQPGVGIVKVVCGHDHSLVLTNFGDVYAWGSNCCGELGHEIGFKHTSDELKTCVKVDQTKMGRVLDIAAEYNNHISAALTEDGRVFMWGHCRGLKVIIPTLTRFTEFDDIFAFYATPSVMHEPLTVYTKGDMTVLKTLEESFNDTETHDLVIDINGEHIHVHRAILKMRSTYFRKMFQKEWLESKQSVIKLDQFSSTVYKAFFKYLYTGVIDLSPQYISELLSLADFYTDEQLKDTYSRIVRKNVNIDNVFHLYCAAIEHEWKEVEDSCFQFASLHMTQVVLSSGFASLDPATTKKFMIRAANAGAFRM